MFGPSLESNLSHSSSNACSLAMATDFFASLLASLFGLCLLLPLLETVFLFFTVGLRCTSSFHHQDSFSL